MSGAMQPECPTCGSRDKQKFRAWSTAFGGKWIPWWKCEDKWHLEEPTKLERDISKKRQAMSDSRETLREREERRFDEWWEQSPHFDSEYLASHSAWMEATLGATPTLRIAMSIEDEKRLVSQLSTAAALFTMEYNQAKDLGRVLDHGLDSVLKPIVREALIRCAMASPTDAAGGVERQQRS